MNDELITEVFDLLSHVQKPQPISRDGVITMLKRWEHNKAWLLPQFGSDYRMEVEFDSTARYDQSATDLLEWDQILAMVSEAAADLTLPHRNFIAYILYYLICSVSVGEIANNLTTKEHQFAVYDSQHKRMPSLTLRKGVKIGKAITTQIKAAATTFMPDVPEEKQEKMVELIAIILSRLTQKVQGRSQSKLVISAHPLDICLMAMSTAGAWTSCMNLKNPVAGFNRVLATGWATDANTIVAYAYERTQKIGDLPYDIPVKIWRELSHIDPQAKAIYWPSEKPSHNAVFFGAVQKKVVKITAQALGLNPAAATLSGTNYSRPTCINGTMYTDYGSHTAYFGAVRSEIRIADVIFTCLNCGKHRADVSPASSTKCNLVCPECMQLSVDQKKAV